MENNSQLFWSSSPLFHMYTHHLYFPHLSEKWKRTKRCDSPNRNANLVNKNIERIIGARGKRITEIKKTHLSRETICL